jgi:hypothetical protein
MSARRLRFLVTALVIFVGSASAVHAAWSTDPAVNLPVSVAAQRQWLAHLTSDGQGGAFVTWNDGRDSASTGSDIYAQHLYGSGTTQWTANGVLVSNQPVDEIGGEIGASVLVPDGTGGLYVSYTTSNPYRAYVQHLHSSGARLWGAGGLSVSDLTGDQINCRIISDGAGGVIACWSGISGATQAVWAQRINSSGTLLWGSSGVTVCSSTGAPQAQKMVGDGAGGAILVWQDARLLGDIDLYVQRINSNGVPQWNSNGEAINLLGGAQHSPTVATDGAGGMVLAWTDDRSGDHQVFAQRVFANGSYAWHSNGLMLCPNCAPNPQHPARIIANNGGAIVTWQQTDAVQGTQALRAQKVDATGNLTWGMGGIPVCLAGNPALGTAGMDTEGNGFVVWSDERNGSSDIYAQRFDASGVVWPANGIVISSADGSQTSPGMTVPFAGLVVAWQDRRNDAGDIFVNRVSTGGDIAVPPSFVTSKLMFSAPSVCRQRAELRFHLPRTGDARLEVLDVSGRGLSTLVSGWMPAGDHRASWDTSSSGSGVYYARLTWNGESRTARFVALH